MCCASLFALTGFPVSPGVFVFRRGRLDLDLTFGKEYLKFFEPILINAGIFRQDNNAFHHSSACVLPAHSQFNSGCCKYAVECNAGVHKRAMQKF
jgi:hypothetical protein